MKTTVSAHQAFRMGHLSHLQAKVRHQDYVQEEKAIQIGQDSLHQQILSAIYFMHSDLDGIDQNVHPKS